MFVFLAALAAPRPILAEDLSDSVAAVVNGDAVTGAWGADPRLHAILRQHYAERSNAPMWVTDGGVTPRGRALAGVLAEADREGLNAADYRPAAVATGLAAKSPGDLAELDVLLSLQLVHYAGDVSAGRLSPQAYDSNIFAAPRDVDEAAILQEAAKAYDIPTFLAAKAPSNPLYRRLRRALFDLREIERDGGWAQVPSGDKLEQGDKGERVAALRRRLTASRDITVPAAELDTFDSGLDAAVRGFQARHGLDADGVVGARTLAALNAPIARRVRQIALNMERWRWLPDDLGDRYVLVNMAGFDLEAVESGSRVLHMRVVVGRTYRQTPVFSDRIRYLEYNPYWTVPPGIARKDILPKVQKDPGYLAAQNIRVFDGWTDGAREVDPASVPWISFKTRIPYRLRQDPGPTNALGRLKFMFPNDFDVYLHDTPARDLFAKTTRTFSSGCIRIEQPLALAAWLLSAEPGWSADRLEKQLASGRNGAIPLSQPVPVHLTYATAWIGEGGTIHFADDIYGRDQLLAEALFGPAAVPHRR